jgi:AmmeMemoRadiSam system protein A
MRCLSEAERKAILELARQAVTEAVCRNRPLPEIPKTGVFDERCGVFVTLHVAKRLRGCIGTIEPKERLGESIARCAAGAALDDPRFSRMRPEEIADLDIEVSLLTPLERIEPEQIEIGKHGLLIEHDVHRGLLLPQVAVEHKLNKEQFLRETCHKAGLRADAWKDPATRIYGFSCEIVFEEVPTAEKKEPAP